MADRFDLDAIEADDALLDLLAAGGESARAAGEHDPALALLADLRLAVEVEDELPVETIDDPESFLARCAALSPITDPFARKVATRGVAIGVAAVAALSVSGVAAAVNGDPLSPYEKVIEKMVDAVRPQTSFPKEDLDGLPVVDRSKIVKVGKDFEKKAKSGQLGTDDSGDDPADALQSRKDVTPPAVVPPVAEKPLVTNFVIPSEPAQTEEPTATKTTEEPTGTTTTAPDDTKTTEPPPSTPTEPPATTTTEPPPATPTGDPTSTTTTPPPSDPTTGTTTPPATVDNGTDSGTPAAPGAGNPTTAPTGDPNAPAGSTDGTGVPAAGDTTAPTGDGTGTPPAGGTTGDTGTTGTTGTTGDTGGTTGTTTPGDQTPAGDATTVPSVVDDLLKVTLDSVATQVVLPTPTGEPPAELDSAKQYFGKPAPAVRPDAVRPDATAKTAGSKAKGKAEKSGKHSSGKVNTGSVRKTYAKGKHSTGAYPEGKHAAIARTHGSTDDASLLTILGILNAPIDPKK
ncbi:hypothetical protein [Kribbella sp. NPDC004536]|uniref:hypothetical protein n=1 Tax=Kribbella sp. NPDC004536 TaxID=3364106 RepID=UPI0036B7FE66